MNVCSCSAACMHACGSSAPAFCMHRLKQHDIVLSGICASLCCNTIGMYCGYRYSVKYGQQY